MTPRPISIVEVGVSYYVHRPTNIIALRGRPVSLRCLLSGKPAPDIRWERNSSILWDASRYSVTDFGTRLTISDVRESDADAYTCIGSNINGTKTVVMSLSVVVSPQFQPGSFPHNMNVTQGSTVNILCRTDAKPVANVQWFKNGDPLQYFNPRMQLSTDLQTLTLTDLCRDEIVCENHGSMVISCKASNGYGYAYASGYINVPYPKQTGNFESSYPSVTTTDLIIKALIFILMALFVIEHAVVIAVARYKNILCFAARPDERPSAGTRTQATYTTVNATGTYTRADASDYVEVYTALDNRERNATTAYENVRS